MALNSLTPLLLSPALPGAMTAIGCGLLLAHVTADFVLQTRAMVRHKRQRRVLLAHAAVHAALAYMAAGCWNCWLIPALTFVSHAGIDGIKARLTRRTQLVFWVDQAAHLLVIGLLATMVAAVGGRSGWPPFAGRDWSAWCVLGSGAILCVRVCAVVIGFWVQPYLDELKAARQGGFAVDAVRGLTDGGRTIGQWERAMIFLLVFFHQPAGIGFLIAAKSIFRFGELMDRKNRMEAEYITIGTLMSFGSAIAIAFTTVALANLFPAPH